MGKKLSVDMTGVETRKLHPEGDYRFTMENAKFKESDDGPGGISFRMKSDSGSLIHYCSLKKDALWKLRATLEAMGIEVPGGKMSLGQVDGEGLIHTWDGLQLEGHVEHEMYEGKKKAKLTDMWPITSDATQEGGEESEEEDDDEPAQDSSAAARAKYDAMDDDTLFAHAKERGAYEKKKAAREAGRETVIGKLVALDLAAPAKDDDEDDEDDDD